MGGVADCLNSAIVDANTDRTNISMEVCSLNKLVFSPRLRCLSHINLSGPGLNQYNLATRRASFTAVYGTYTCDV